MSIPAFGWAMQRGRELKLSTALRMLLIAIADRQNGDTYCTASQHCLALDTGLTTRRVRDLAPMLEKLGLIAIEPFGRFLRYQVIRPQVGEASSGVKRRTAEASSAMTPEASSGNGHATPEASSAKHRKPVPLSPVDNSADTGNVSTRHRKYPTETPEAISAKPYYNQEREPKSAPACAGTSAAGAAQPEAKVLNNGGEASDGTPPPAPPKAPTLGTQPAGAAPNQAMRRPGAQPPDSEPDPFADGGESNAYLADLLGKRTMHLAADNDDRITEDDPPQTSGDRDRMAAQMARQLEQLGRELRMRAYPPGRFPALTPEEQIDVVTPQRPVPRYLPDEVLNQMPHRQRARSVAAATP
jgi:hypothetical protein